MKQSKVAGILEENLHPLWSKVNALFLEELRAEFMIWSASPELEKNEQEAYLMEMVVHFLAVCVNNRREAIERVEGLRSSLKMRYARTETDRERQAVILEFAEALGASAQDLAHDRRAFSRWFGADAVLDRCRRQVAKKEREMTFLLNRLGAVSALFLCKHGPVDGYREVWRRLNIEIAIRAALTYEGDARVTVEALRILSGVAAVMPNEIIIEVLEADTVQHIYRAALERGRSVWLQIAALRLLAHLSPLSLFAVLKKHLGHPLADRDHLFLRRRSVFVLGENLAGLPDHHQLLEQALGDPSPYVRQAIVPALASTSAQILLPAMTRLAHNDAVPQVRAAVLVEMVELVKREELRESILEILTHTLRRETDSFVLRTALTVSSRSFSVLMDECGGDGAEAWFSRLAPVVETLHASASSFAVRRWAAQTRELMWCDHHPQARALKDLLRKEIAAAKPGKVRRLSDKILEGHEDDLLGRVLSALAQYDYGFEINAGPKGKTIRRGHSFGFRFWRLLHELKNPSPEKRQAFSHTRGRVFHGFLHVPSTIMAELTETKVPGEPLFMASEAGWRPYLPLLDEVLSLFGRKSGSLKIYTSEGVTVITPPGTFAGNLKAWLLITLRFARYAHLRNWKEQAQRSPDSYLAALGELGVTAIFRGYSSAEGKPMEDAAVKRFFPALLPFADQNIWERIQDYFFSVYENSLEHLLLFTTIIAAVFFGQKFYKNIKLSRARKRFPVVIGGWGTRGKSGTERMKAALIQSLGFSFVAKTTGCEAMLLQAYPYDTISDFFLFRPYDKATIWEQHNVVAFADRLGAEFMLWECMALQPAYVRVLQRNWLRDDISTITNAYPDHEDHQGPAGINIPEVMTNFIPESAVLITTEDLMRPILAQAAHELHTRIRSAGWLEAGLITQDILDRFPYEEHPSNIALVMELACELGVETDYALKEIADRIIPDIGVLKIFAAAPVDGRKLQFVNGMSANDRYGCLSNWERTGFASHDPLAEPGVWITTVVNNRADRIARSRVFAGILVEDLMADRHFLIGSNLTGLMGYIREAWEEYSGQLTLQPAHGGDAKAYLESIARRFRLPVSNEHVCTRLQAALRGLGLEISVSAAKDYVANNDNFRDALLLCGKERYADALSQSITLEKDAWNMYRSFRTRVEAATDEDWGKLDGEFRQKLTAWFMAKFIIIDDVHASGEQIIDRITKETPPGLTCRIMGIQNIKGTGLDFVYRWQAWDRCFKACRNVREGSAAEVDAGLKQLATFQEFGLLSGQWVRQTVQTVKAMPNFQAERTQAALSVILSTLETQLEKVRKSLTIARKEGLLQRSAEIMEAFLDASYSIQRRKKADQIYQDIVDERISRERAIFELQQLNKEQKGGWLRVVARLSRMDKYIRKYFQP